MIWRSHESGPRLFARTSGRLASGRLPSSARSRVCRDSTFLSRIWTCAMRPGFPGKPKRIRTFGVSIASYSIVWSSIVQHSIVSYVLLYRTSQYRKMFLCQIVGFHGWHSGVWLMLEDFMLRLWSLGFCIGKLWKPCPPRACGPQLQK